MITKPLFSEVIIGTTLSGKTEYVKFRYPHAVWIDCRELNSHNIIKKCKRKNKIYVLDDFSLKSNNEIEYWSRELTYARHKKKKFIFIVHSPFFIDINIRRNIGKIIVFRVFESRDKEYIADLLPLTKKESIERLNSLPQYHYYYIDRIEGEVSLRVLKLRR